MSRGRTVPSMTRALLIAAVCALGACSEPRPTEPTPPAANSGLLGPSGPALVECPSSETLTATASLSASLETVLSLGGTRVVIPPGAALAGTRIDLTVPASRYVEVQLRANGEEHFQFALPLLITIDYSRCNRNDVLTRPVSAWYIDSQTKELQYRMEDGIDSKLTRSVTFSTDHFSGYAIAF